MKFESLNKDDRIFVAGHNGMVGQALCRRLKQRGYHQVLTVDRKQCDLTNAQHVNDYLGDQKPTMIIVAAAKVGGIKANNTERATFILDNIKISANLIEGAHKHNIGKLIYLSSSCVYPKECPQPISEDDLLTGELEPTNRPYALAKIAGMEMVNAVNEQYGRGYYSVLPCNLYGPGDNFDPDGSHVIPGLLRRMLTAKKNGDEEFKIWGTGKAKREFMHVDDCADGILFLAENLTAAMLHTSAGISRGFYHYNLGSGEEISVAGLAQHIQTLTGYAGKLVFDQTQPDGTQRKLLDSARVRQLGWAPQISLEQGLADVISWVRKSYPDWAC